MDINNDAINWLVVITTNIITLCLSVYLTRRSNIGIAQRKEWNDTITPIRRALIRQRLDIQAEGKPPAR
ncbi:hypothetical protein P4S73_04765 [Paraglaciecola sp. Hal342]